MTFRKARLAGEVELWVKRVNCIEESSIRQIEDPASKKFVKEPSAPLSNWNDAASVSAGGRSSRICDANSEKIALRVGCCYQSEAKAMSLRRKLAPPRQRLSRQAQRATPGSAPNAGPIARQQ